MNACLLFADRPMEARWIGEHPKQMAEDLHLELVLRAIARGDRFIHETAEQVILESLSCPKQIQYRQSIMQDALEHPECFGRLYQCAGAALEQSSAYGEYAQKSHETYLPVSSRLIRATELLDTLVKNLADIKHMTAQLPFASEGMTRFVQRLDQAFPAVFFQHVQKHVAHLKAIAKDGRIVIGVSLGLGLKGSRYVLREIKPMPPMKKRKKRKLEHNAIELVHTIQYQSAQQVVQASLVHILRLVSFLNKQLLNLFRQIRFESAFYLGGIHLYDTLEGMHMATAFPSPQEGVYEGLCFQGLYDMALALDKGILLTDNELEETQAGLVIITGANQGGKSTYLRSIGLAQLCMQCGLFVAAKSFDAGIRQGIFTHFTKKEDSQLKSGKLDEELGRISRIVDDIRPGSMLLINEAFTTTTERDGSLIAREVLRAMREAGIQMLFVTHLFELADALYHEGGAVFLRAQREEDGRRPYRIAKGAPLSTSYAHDLFEDIFLDDPMV